MTTLFAELMAGAIGDIDRFERVEATIAKTPLRPCRASAKLRRRSTRPHTIRATLVVPTWRGSRNSRRPVWQLRRRNGLTPNDTNRHSRARVLRNSTHRNRTLDPVRVSVLSGDDSAERGPRLCASRVQPSASYDHSASVGLASSHDPSLSTLANRVSSTNTSRQRQRRDPIFFSSSSSGIRRRQARARHTDDSHARSSAAAISSRLRPLVRWDRSRSRMRSRCVCSTSPRATRVSRRRCGVGSGASVSSMR